MTTKPKCKKCGRVLSDPVSIACGVGPECRGASGRKARKVGPRQKARQARAYRAEALLSGDPVLVGPATYTKNGDTWQSDKGVKISESDFAAWLKRYGLISPVEAK